VNTGWDQYWNSEMYFENPPYLTQDSAQYLIDCRVKLVGIDSMNIDNTQGKSRPVHSLLLQEEIPIVEHLCCLDQLPDEGFTFTAIPPKFKGYSSKAPDYGRSHLYFLTLYQYLYCSLNPNLE
jgi:arylformamidase